MERSGFPLRSLIASCSSLPTTFLRKMTPYMNSAPTILMRGSVPSRSTTILSTSGNSGSHYPPSDLCFFQT